jgi:hypothetical protein
MRGTNVKDSSVKFDECCLGLSVCTTHEAAALRPSALPILKRMDRPFLCLAGTRCTMCSRQWLVQSPERVRLMPQGRPFRRSRSDSAWRPLMDMWMDRRTASSQLELAGHSSSISPRSVCLSACLPACPSVRNLGAHPSPCMCVFAPINVRFNAFLSPTCAENGQAAGNAQWRRVGGGVAWHELVLGKRRQHQGAMPRGTRVGKRLLRLLGWQGQYQGRPGRPIERLRCARQIQSFTSWVTGGPLIDR